MSDDVTGQSMTGNVPVYASAMVFIGVWGMVLAFLNMFSMAHPTYHVSWGGLFTFEATNAAFGDAKDGFHFEMLGDTIFIIACAGLIGLGSKIIGQHRNLGDWIKGLVINDTWPALNDLSTACVHFGQAAHPSNRARARAIVLRSIGRSTGAHQTWPRSCCRESYA